MSEFFHLIIQSNTLNFLLVLALIIFLVKKLDVNKRIENIREELKNYVDDSDNEKKSAEEALLAAEEKVRNLPEEIGQIKAGTENSVRSIDEKIKADTESKKQDISNNSERIMQLEIKKFKSKLTNILSSKSVEIARRNAQAQLENNRELHDLYIDNAINELDRIAL